MASTFTALPLTSGEAFVLETEHEDHDYVVLFDGGQTKTVGPKNGLYRALREHCPGVHDRIDIAICSHSDHDHSGGFPSFMETWVSEGNEIGEFWLPALWSPALPEVLVNPDRLLGRLRNGAASAARMVLEAEPSRSLGDGMSPLGTGEPAFRSVDQIIRSAGVEQLREPDMAGLASLTDDRVEPSREATTARSLGLTSAEMEIVRRNIEESHLLNVPLGERIQASRPPIHWYFDGEAQGRQMEALQLEQTLMASVTETAEAIQKIAKVAVSHGIPIRWFDFTPFENHGAAPVGGIPGLLEPLNTVEKRDVRREENNLALFYSLKLTEQNVSSLVFQRVETASEPSVIFVADSRLAFGIDRPERDFPNHLKPVTRPCIFTAAHHGSRNNDKAYEVLEKWLGQGLFQRSLAVRNGGVHNQTLDGFLDVKNRRCAQCYQCHGGDWSQLVAAGTAAGNWSWPPDQGGVCGVAKAKRK